MNKINIDNWKEFKISEIFLDLRRGALPIFRNLNKGEMPVIAASMFNQGITGYYDVPSLEKNRITVSLNGVGSGYFAYHDYEFAANSDCGILIEKYQLNKYSAMFLCAILNKIGTNYGYEEKVTKPKLFEEVILLPATQTGEPDFQYMEDYIKNIEELQNRNLQIIKLLIPPPNKNVNTVSWGIFQLSKLFDVKKGTRLTKANMIDGNINFIGASAMNNGVTAKISNNTHIHPANTITVSYNGSVGATFYQAEYFWASDDVNVLYPKFEMNQQIAFFIIPIIKQLGKQYAFIDKWKKEDMEKTFIPLPMTLSGEPDFQYMEQTITALIVQQQAKLQLTQTIFA